MSKRIWHHPDVPAGETTVSWRSSGQLEDTPAFREWLDREFPQGAAEMADPADAETSRRSFLKLMGASTALAGFGMAACRRPESYIVPYTKAPEWVIPGKATYYASAMPRAHGATPLVVTTFDGRPTKLAPNNLHPDAEGTDAFAQASILDLYSPSRSRRVLKAGKPAKRADLDAALAAIAADKSAKIGFLFGADDSPTRNRLARELAEKFQAARFYQYEALAPDGGGVKLVADFAKADRILALDCDFAGTDPQGPVTPFFDRRKPEGKAYEANPDASKMNRLYAVESAFTLTGGMADHRLRVTPSQLEWVARALAATLGVPGATAVQLPGDQSKWVHAMAADLKDHGGRSLVLAGSRQSAAVHQIALSINQILGNIGEGKPLLALLKENQPPGSLADLKADIDAGDIDTLFLLTPANPVYDAPADLGFAAALAKVQTSIHLCDRANATAHAASWHIPAAHYLESWSDTRSATGTYTVVQPMILPLYADCVSELELLLALLSDDGKLLNGEGPEGAASPAYTAVRTTFAALGGEGDSAWKALLRDGFLAGSAYPAASPAPRADVSAPLVAQAPSTDSLEIIFATDS
jgi:MoCo/4Fe-4S cofactor protein with predicted Tat translocation signal